MKAIINHVLFPLFEDEFSVMQSHKSCHCGVCRCPVATSNAVYVFKNTLVLHKWLCAVMKREIDHNSCVTSCDSNVLSSYYAQLQREYV